MFNRFFVILICFTVLASACNNLNSETKNDVKVYESNRSSKIQFSETISNLGKVKQGEKVFTWFDYKNVGDGLALIENIRAGCGCTIPEWDKEPVAPGEDQSIKVVFDSAGKTGVQNINVTVYTNGEPGQITLRIMAEVI
ncbi:MAG TPA: DUF1573 domain-containing protein [Bacteroidales bacterium]|nr:DUF1573 domain-containing protein [Bacteroidales bacterium]